MKNKLIILLSIIFIDCTPDYENNFRVLKSCKNYRIWASYYTKEKDSIELNWLLSYQIENNTFRGVKFDWVRKRPFYTYQATQMILNDSLVLFNNSITDKSVKELNLYVSKIVSAKDFPDYALNNENEIKTFGDYHKNITKIPREQIKFKESRYFQNILKEIENDSIALVFHDTVAGDYFQFKGIVKDKKLKFSR
jgi:hypothetical protein